MVQIEVSAGSLLGGSAGFGPKPFATVREAEREAAGVLAASVSHAADLFAANARLQSMMGQVEGPLSGI